MKSFLPLAVVIAFVGSGIANAITITASDSAPATLIVEQQPTVGGAYAFQWIGNGLNEHTAQAQSFRHDESAYAVDKITVLFNPQGNAATFNAGTNLNIRLYLWTPGDGAGTPVSGTPGTPFLEETGVLPNGWVNNTPRYLTFDITDQNLAQSQQYGFAVDFTTAVAPGAGFSATLVAALHGIDIDASYPKGGKRLYTEHDVAHEGNADYDGNDDLVFFIQAPVPEPSSFVLAGLGLIGLVGYVRRRNRG